MQDIVDVEFVPFGNGAILRPLKPGEVQGPSMYDTPNVLNKTSELLPVLKQFNEPWEPVPKIQVLCQHGMAECQGDGWESCIQDVAPKTADNWPVLHCMESRSCAEDMKPPQCVGTPQEVVQDCVKEFGKNIDVGQLLQCVHGSRGTELDVMNDIATLDANIQWAPWLTVDGKDVVQVGHPFLAYLFWPIFSPCPCALANYVAVPVELTRLFSTQNPNNPDTAAAFREQFLLGKKICDAYTAKTGMLITVTKISIALSYPRLLADWRCMLSQARSHHPRARSFRRRTPTFPRNRMRITNQTRIFPR